MSDDFFDDEQELMEAEGGEPSAPAPADAKEAVGSVENDDEKQQVKVAAAKPQRQAPPFWMVLAIAAIALILGIVIGYLLGTQATLAELSSASSSTTTMTSSSGSSSDTSYELPEGHPDVTVDEDGNATLADSGSSEE